MDRDAERPEIVGRARPAVPEPEVVADHEPDHPEIAPQHLRGEGTGVERRERAVERVDDHGVETDGRQVREFARR